MVVAREADPGALARTQATIRAESVGSVAAVEVADLAHGYARALGDFARRFPSHDIVCVRAGAELPFAWDARLAKAAYAADGIAAAVPLCDASMLHAVVEDENRE